jgi:hypothetical protein
VIRQRAFKAILIVVGLLFTATAYPLVMFLWQEPVLAMMLSLYVTLGILLLLAARDPAAHRSLIAFAAWSSLAHAVVMVVQSSRMPSERAHLVGGSAGLVLIGMALILLAPPKVKGASM